MEETMNNAKETVDKDTGEVTAIVDYEVSGGNGAGIVPYQGIAIEPFDDKAQKVLLAPVEAKDVQLRPDGIVYKPQVKTRQKLNVAFGVGAWAIRPMSKPFREGTRVMFAGELWVNGRYVAFAIGGHEYRESNQNQGWDDAVEAAKSDCLVRCCKDLGIDADLWDPDFIKNWLAENAVAVWCINENTKKKNKLWRKKADPPISAWPWKELTGSESEQAGSNGGTSQPNGNREYLKCPTCGKTAVIKSKAEYGGGYVCWKNRDGCGAKFKTLENGVPTNPVKTSTSQTSQGKSSKDKSEVDMDMTANIVGKISEWELKAQETGKVELFKRLCSQVIGDMKYGDIEDTATASNVLNVLVKNRNKLEASK
jgi:hypothetical protein